MVVGHREKPGIDLPFLAPTHPVNSGPHIVIDPTPRHAAENPKPMPMGIKEHLMGLKQTGPNQEGPTVRQLHMSNLQLGALTAENGIVLAPVELECLTGTESQGNKGAAPGGLLFPLTVGPPVPRKARVKAATRL
jgi:hypothetical protein